MTTFLFTDIENSTRLWEIYGDRMQAVLAQHDRLLSAAVRQHGGRIIRHRGDGLSVVFEHGQPLACAIAMQQAMQQADWGELPSFHIRIGLNAGQAQLRHFHDETMGQKEEFFGRVLNRTARIMDSASGGQIVFSPTVLEETMLPTEAAVDDFGLHLLKSLDDPQPIFGLLHPSLPQQFPPLKSLARIDAKRPSSPYKGLFAFEEADAPFFFGREIFTDLLLKVVERQSLSAVIGPSGSGKSSVVYAGLMPHLRQQPDLIMADFRPGQHPIHALASVLMTFHPISPTPETLEHWVTTWRANPALVKETVAQIFEHHAPTPQRLVLIANQFEELFTLCNDMTIRRQFLDILFTLLTVQFDTAHAVSACHVVLTLRADFMAQALSHRPFADAIQLSSVILGPMKREELERAIKRPAEQQGVRFEDGLVERILNDVGSEAGNLPLLQFALTLLWERQEKFSLTHTAYESIGHVEGALTHHANLIYQELSQAERLLAHKIFIQLVTPGEGTEDTRRVAHRVELGEESWQLVQQLADARLVVTNLDLDNHEVVEVVHEALIRNWGQLHIWLNEDRVFRGWQERLRAVLPQWQASGQDPDALLRGAPLMEAEEWLNQREDELGEAEQIFIKTSLQQRQAEQDDLEKQHQRELEQAQALAEAQHHRAEVQARLSQRLRWLAIGLAIVFLMAVSAAWWAYGESNRAHNEAQARATEILIRSTAEAEAIEAKNDAVRSSQASLVQSLLAHALRLIEQTNDTELVSLLVLEALTINQTIDGSANTEIEQLLRRMLQHPYYNTTLHEHTDWVNHITFSPNGRWLASASDDSTIRLWDLTAPSQPATVLRGHTHWVWAVAFSPDGQQLASAGRDGRLLIWDMATLSEPIEVLTVGEEKEVLSTAFSPDGQWLAAGTNVTGMVWIWPTANYHADPTVLSGHESLVRMVRFSPDGTMLASASDDDTINLWSMADLTAEPTVLSGHTGRVRSIDFSPDGELLASGGHDSTVRLWDMTNPTVDPTILEGHTDIVRAVRFQPDGKQLVSSATDGTIRLWDLDDLGQHEILQGDESRIISAEFHPDGHTLATSSFGTIRLWNVDKPVTPLTYNASEPPTEIHLSPTGATLIVNLANQKLVRLSLDELQFIETIFERETEPNGELVISPDKKLVAYQEDKTVKVVAIDTQNVIREIPITVEVVGQIQFSPNQTYLAVDLVEESMIQLWPLNASSPSINLPYEDKHEDKQDFIPFIFSPDEQFLVAGNSVGELSIWSIQTPATVPQIVQGSIDRILSLAFSPDGQTLAVGHNEDYVIYLWNMADLQAAPQSLIGHELGTTALQFSQDGRYLFSGSYDNTVRLWDLPPPTAKLKVFLEHPTDIVDVALTADNQQIISVDKNSTIRLWLTDINKLKALTCQQVRRNLTQAEWAEYLREDQAYRQTCPEWP